MEEYKKHKSLNYSHRNASLSNEKEKHDYASVCKFWDRCKEDVQHSYKRQEKALKQKLSLLKQEQKFHKKERSCLDGSSYSSLAEKTPPTRKSSSRYRMKQKMDQDASSPPSAHDVAAGLLQSHSGKRHSKSFREKTQLPDPGNGKVKPAKTRHITKDSKLPSIIVTKSGKDDLKPEPTTSRRRASHDTSFGSSQQEDVDNHGQQLLERLPSFRKPRRHTISDARVDHQITRGRNGNQSPEDRSKLLSTQPARRGSLDTRERVIDGSVLDHYYKLLALSENSSDINENDPLSSSQSYGPLSTYKRSQRRKTLALEEILKQLPSFKKKDPTFNPAELLRCSYLRLSESNIEALEEMCRDEGFDPGIHIHMTEDQILEKFKEADLNLKTTD